MTHEWDRSEQGPSPARLMAYADNELEPGERARVEAWLLDHPEAAAELETLRRLERLWQAAAAPEPAPEAWAAVLARVEASLPRQVPARPRIASRLLWGASGVAAAAAVLGAVLLARSLGPGLLPPTNPAASAEEPFPVASAEDVTIISMDAHDLGALVVGQPPVQEGPLEMASRDDVKVLNVEPAWPDGPVARFVQGDEIPMLWSSVIDNEDPEP
jgi:anti-sigma factor RsiW